MNGAIVGLLLVVGIIGLYFLTYVLNKNTAVPEGTPIIDKCSTCGTSGACALKGTDEVEECEI